MDTEIIHALLVSEFHDHVGKQIICQYPNKDQLITQSDLDNIVDYLIPKDELCGRLIVVDFKNDLFILNMAVLLRHDKNQKIYLREKYIFSIAMLIERTTYNQRPHVFQEALRKLAFVFTNLENTRHLVYQHQQGFQEIDLLLQTSFIQLNSSRETVIELDENVFIFVSLNEPLKTQSQIFKTEKDIKYHEVPLPLMNLQNGIETQFDPVAAKVLPEICIINEASQFQINGVISVGTICERCNPYTSQQVRQCIASLAQYQLIKMVDMIKLTNCYSVKDEIFKFFKDDKQVKAACKYIFLDNFESINNLPKNEAQKAILQALISGFRKDIHLEEYIILNKKFMPQVNLIQILYQINLHKLIRYGQFNNLIMRFSEYPLTLKDRTNRYFDQNNYKQYLVNWVPPNKRFNESEVTSPQHPYFKNKTNIHPQNQHSIAHSQSHQNQITTNTLSNNIWLPTEQEESKKLIDQANELMNTMVKNSQSLDEICLYFNIDQENFIKIVQTFEVHIIHK